MTGATLPYHVSIGIEPVLGAIPVCADLEMDACWLSSWLSICAEFDN